MEKPKTRLKNRVRAILKGMEVPESERPRLEDGSLDVQKLNDHPNIVQVKKDLMKASIEIIGKNIIDRDWLFDNGFVVAGLTFNNKIFYDKN